MTFVAKILENPVEQSGTHCSVYGVTLQISFFLSVGRHFGRLRRFKLILSPFQWTKIFGCTQKKMRYEVSIIILHSHSTYIFAFFRSSNFALALIPTSNTHNTHTHVEFTATKIRHEFCFFVRSLVHSVLHLQCNLEHMVDGFFYSFKHFTFFLFLFIFYENSIIHSNWRKKRIFLCNIVHNLWFMYSNIEMSFQWKKKWNCVLWVLFVQVRQCMYVLGSTKKETGRK